MKDIDKKELKQMCKSEWSFEDIKDCVNCSDSTIKRYMNIFNPSKKTR